MALATATDHHVDCPANATASGEKGIEKTVSSVAVDNREAAVSLHPAEPEIIFFARGDPENPYNWSKVKKLYISLTAVLLVMNSNISSAITSNAIYDIMAAFGVQGRIQSFLPTTVYLIGYSFGPLVFSPLSESYGRKVVMLWTFTGFAIFSMATALSPNWPALLVFRLFCGTCASVPLTVIGGLFADIFGDATTRGRAMIAFMTGTTFGPVCGPIISGYVVGPLGWRWVVWVVVIFAGCSWVPLVFVPETYGPVILKWRAQKQRKTAANPNAYASIELENKSIRELVGTTLTRPLRMLLFEPLVYLNCLSVALVYAFFYLFFEAYPIIFKGTYHFSNGQSALALLPIGLGAGIAGPLLIAYDTFFERARRRGAAWAENEDYLRLPVACMGGPCCVVSQLWLGWTDFASVPWIVPCLSGLLFGIGYMLIFTALINYQVDAYRDYAASAMAASCFSRSIVGAVLPLAAQPLYHALGVHWAPSTLGFLSLILVAIPFALIHYAPRIRQNSKMCQDLRRRAESEKIAESLRNAENIPLQV